ncbi:MAG TPA: response regulator transcription factor [Ktedonobacteraceae bacterium]|jgi:DNA-binding NarL/FixJ family response regulator|nr:response regulator transcription factor [Ktedonobacteraceae bacterium]
MSDQITLPTRQIRVILADDHEILRQGLRLLLQAQPDIEVVGEARTGLDAINQVARLLPDVVVLDISMPGMDGLEACQRIRIHYPTIQVLILTMHESEEYFLQALRMGAAGYLVKKIAPGELSSAVRTIAAGGAFLYPGLAKALIRAYLTPTTPKITPTTERHPDGPEQTSRSENKLAVLTPRELEVLTMVAEGHTNQEIANHLVLSIKTVQAHRANVMEKLGLHDITHLVRFALRHGLIAPEP